MNVTKDGIKHRKLQTEGCLQKVPAEQGGYVEVCSPSRITENNITNACSSTDRLLEKILDRDNMNLAYQKVKSNKGASGIDGMEVDELRPYLRKNGWNLIRQIRDGKYKPNPVCRVVHLVHF
jgi:retron-type reverse transcriptase